MGQSNTKGLGAPPGNNNLRRGTEWRQSIKRSLARLGKEYDEDCLLPYREGLALITDVLVRSAAEGNRWAIEELGNRTDGKPQQSIELSGDPDRPVGVALPFQFVTPEAPENDPVDDDD